MSSNENDAMRCNEVLVETNILICYTHESELQMQSYDMKKYANNYWDLENFNLAKVNPGWREVGRCRSGSERGVWFGDGWISSRFFSSEVPNSGESELR